MSEDKDRDVDKSPTKEIVSPLLSHTAASLSSVNSNQSSLTLAMLPIKESIITIIFTRIDTLLPYKSGFTVPQVECDPFYIKTKSHIIKLASIPSFLDDLISCCYNILISILDDSGATTNSVNKSSSNPNLVNINVNNKLYSLSNKNAPTLSSIFLILSLMASILNTVRSNDLSDHPTGSILKLVGMKVTPNYFTGKDYSFIPSTSINTIIVKKILVILANFKSNNETLSCLLKLTSNESTNHSFDSRTMLEDYKELKRIINTKDKNQLTNLIDENISSIIMYISSTNPGDYLEFLKIIFKRINVDALFIPHSDFLNYIFLTSSNVNSHVNLIKDIIHVTKRHSQQCSILFLFSNAILSWATYRTEDFLKATEAPTSSKNFEVLFDSLHKLLDSKSYSKVYYRILSCLILFQPKQFTRFIEDKSLKSTTYSIKRSVIKLNSKQKFLNDFVQLISKNPECADSLTKILFVGCATEIIDPSNPLVLFIHFVYKSVYKELQMDNPEFILKKNVSTSSSSSTNESSSSSISTISSVSTNSNSVNSPLSLSQSYFIQLMENLRTNLFAISIMINTNEMIQRVNDVFSDSYSPLNLLLGISGGIKQIMEVPSMAEKIFFYIQEISPTFLHTMTEMAIFLRENENIGKNNGTDSSSSSGNTTNVNNMGNNTEIDLSRQNNASASSTSTPSIPSSAVSKKSLVNYKTSALGIPSISRAPSVKLSYTKALTNKMKTSFRTSSNHSSTSSSASSSSNFITNPVHNSVSNSNSNSNSNSSSNSHANYVPYKISTKPLSEKSNISVSSLNSNNELNNNSSESSEDLNYFRIKVSNRADLKKPTNILTKSKFSNKAFEISNNVKTKVKKILTNMMTIYKIYPFLCYIDVGDYPNSDFGKFERCFKKFIDPIVSLLIDDDKKLIKATENFLLTFASSLANRKILRVFVAYFATSILIDSISQVTISPDINHQRREYLIKFIARLLDDRKDYSDLDLMYKNRKIIDTIHESGICSRLVKNFERVVFLGLFSDNLDTVRTSRRLLQAYVYSLTSKHHYDTCFEKSNLVLAQSILAEKLPVGAVAIRKKLRDHLCELKDPTELMLDVWSIMYEKLSIAHCYSEMPNTDDQEIVNNYLMNHNPVESVDVYGEYMASLGGIIMSPSFANDMRQPFMQQSLETFLNYKMVNLFGADPKKREHCREILSVCVHPYLCGLLLNLVKKFLPKFEMSLNGKEYNVCEMFLSVIRSLSQIEWDSLFFNAVEMWEVNYKLLKMLNVNNVDPVFLRLKLKFCKMEVLFLGKMDKLSMHGNILKKNEYARIAADYLENSFNFESSEFTTIKPTKVLSFGAPSNQKISTKLEELKKSELKDLHLDIKVETSFMLKTIFFRLPLDTPRHNYGQSEDDKSVAGVVFSNYFNLFVRILERLNVMKNELDQSMANKHRSSSIIKDIIQALINLLSANSDIGLKYSLPLGYHDDKLIRVSFINVFSKIIKEIYSDSNKKDLPLLYSTITNLLISDTPLLLSTAFSCPKSDIEAFANALLEISTKKTVQLNMITSLIRFDVINTSDSNEILRSNTVGTRLVALYSRYSAADYLVDLFRPVFKEMVENVEFFEIEKVLNKSNEDKERNVKLFLKYLNLITNRICDSLENIPSGIRLISKTIFEATAETFPDLKFTALSAYLFLRLYNPAIVVPERVDIIDCEEIQFKRSLIQLARVIQMIVNESSLRFPLIESRSEEIESIRKKLFDFMRDVVSFNANEELKKLENTASLQLSNSGTIIDSENFDKVTVESSSKNCAIYFHSFFYDNWMNIRENYCNNSYSNDEDKLKNIRIVDNVLLTLGLPSRIKGYQIPESVKSDKSEKGLLLYDFMSQTSLNQDDCSFIKVLITKDGLPLILFASGDIPEDLSPETFVYGLIQTLTKYWEFPYCFLFDCTSYSGDEFLYLCRKLYTNMVPVKYRLNCKRMYFVNLSPRFFQTLKDFNREFSEAPEVKPEYILLSTNDDIKSLNKNGLLGYSNEISNDARVIFHDVSLYQLDAKRFIPVKLKIGNEFIQIYSGLPQRVKLAGKMHVVNLVDCHKIKDLEDIGASTYTGVSNEISMVDTKSNDRIILASPKKIEIMRTLYFSRARLNSNAIQSFDDFGNGNGNLNPKYAVGQLLNISLSGLISREDDIRNSSYSLLASVTDCVGLQTGKHIDSVEGVVFPFGDVQYICSISAEIAIHHPDLAYPFLYGFFQAFEDANADNKNIIVVYASPWIKNIYNHVYLSDAIKGPGRSKDLIRKFVRASRMSLNNTQAFSLFVWPQLSREDPLIEMTIDEIVAAAIDHEAEGHDWQEITKYWPLSPTIEICSLLIKKLRNKSYVMPIVESEIEAHTRWIETTVLAKFLAYLIFDSLLFAERFLSDIFYIVTIYMDNGPLELRITLLKLLTRTFHSYLSKSKLTKTQHSLIKEQIELLNGARFRMLFGLTRDDDDDRYKTPSIVLGTDMTNKANSVSTLCELLTSFLRKFSEPQDYDLQMVKWNSYIMNVAFNSNAQLQTRGILVMGSLTKQGISNVLVSKFVELLEQTSTSYVYSTPDTIARNLNLIICTLHAFGDAIEGVVASSLFHPLVFWLGFAITLLDNVSFYQYGAQYIRSVLIKINSHLKDKDITLIEYLFKYKKIFGTIISDFEKMFFIEVDEENFDAVMVAICGKGLEEPFAYQTSIDALETFLTVRYSESIKFNSANTDYCCYLYYIYLLAADNNELIKTLKNCGIGDVEMVMSVNNCMVPKVLLEWLTAPRLNVFSTCLSTTNYFMNQKLDELASSRMVAVFVEIYKINPKLTLGLFKHVREILQKFVGTASTAYLLETVLNMIVNMMDTPEFKVRGEYEKEWLEKLQESKISGIRGLVFSCKDVYSDGIVSADVKKIRYEYIKNMMERVRSVYADEM